MRAALTPVLALGNQALSFKHLHLGFHLPFPAFNAGQ
jgi:hypothetical protein